MNLGLKGVGFEEAVSPIDRHNYRFIQTPRIKACAKFWMSTSEIKVSKHRLKGALTYRFGFLMEKGFSAGVGVLRILKGVGIEECFK